MLLVKKEKKTVLDLIVLRIKLQYDWAWIYEMLCYDYSYVNILKPDFLFPETQKIIHLVVYSVHLNIVFMDIFQLKYQTFIHLDFSLLTSINMALK